MSTPFLGSKRDLKLYRPGAGLVISYGGAIDLSRFSLPKFPFKLDGLDVEIVTKSFFVYEPGPGTCYLLVNNVF
jgi:hypothetical protein